MEAYQLKDDLYDKYMIKKDLKLFQDKEQSLSARKLRYYLSIPIKNKKIGVIFKKSYHKLRCLLSWQSMINDLRLYGTGSTLFNATFSYKKNIHTVMDKNRLHSIIEDESSQVTSWRNLLIHPSSSFKLFWDIAMLVFAMYSLITVPFFIAFFESEDPNFSDFDVFVDALFVLDIVLKLNTALIDKQNRPVKNRKIIFVSYLKGLLILDIISVFPFWAILEYTQGPSFRVLRLFRLLRLSKAMNLDSLVKKIPVKSFQKLYNSVEGISRLFIGLFLIIIMIHLVSCFWNYAAVIENFSPDTWITRYGIEDYPPDRKYLEGIYFAFTVLMTVGFGDITAYTKIEMIICIIWELIGIAFYSFVFGTISSVLTAMDQKNSLLSKKLQMVDLFSQDTKIPSTLVKRIIKEVKDSSSTLSLDYDEKIKLVSNLPKHLREMICEAMYDGAAKKLFFFQDKPIAFTVDIFPKLVFIEKKDREVLYTKGEFADEMYFLIKGRISFVFGRENLVFKSMIAGSYFGEIEMIEQVPREFGAMAVGECSLLVMPKGVFHYMMEMYPKVSNEIKEVAVLKKIKIESAMQDIIELIDSVHIRKEHTLSEIAGTCKPYKSRDFPKIDSSKNRKNPSSLYKIEFENRFLKKSLTNIHFKIDELENKMKDVIKNLVSS